jgi:hypothetical protein
VVSSPSCPTGEKSEGRDVPCLNPKKSSEMRCKPEGRVVCSIFPFPNSVISLPPLLVSDHLCEKAGGKTYWSRYLRCNKLPFVLSYRGNELGKSQLTVGLGTRSALTRSQQQALIVRSSSLSDIPVGTLVDSSSGSVSSTQCSKAQVEFYQPVN